MTPCKGMNCNSTNGLNHSPECEAEHAAAIAGGRFIKSPAMIFVQIAAVSANEETFVYALGADGMVYEQANRYYPRGTDFNGKTSNRAIYGGQYWKPVDLPFEAPELTEEQIKQACL